MSHILSYAINHAVAPKMSFAELVGLASELGLEQVELRNDLAGVPIGDGTPAARIRDEAEAAAVRILAINALQRFNDWNDERASEAARLARHAADCGAKALVLCPVSDPGYRPSESERQGNLREALGALAPIVGDVGIVGLVEPLGFEESSLRLKEEAVEAIDELDLGDQIKILHDTFHHYLTGEVRTFPEHTGLVHVSGVDNDNLPPARLRDEHRVLLGANDTSGGLLQILALMEGYSGAYSFESFAASVQDAGDIAGALEASMHWIDREIAQLPA